MTTPKRTHNGTSDEESATWAVVLAASVVESARAEDSKRLAEQRHAEHLQALRLSSSVCCVALLAAGGVSAGLVLTGKAESAVQVMSIALSGFFGFLAGRSRS